MTSQTRGQEKPGAEQPTEEQVARMAVIGAFGGIAAGFLVGGIGGRLVMRILAMVNDEKAGVLTENGDVSGDITIGGTVGLILLVGIIVGGIGGLVYIVIRRWLPGGGLLKGLVYGLVLLCFFGSVVFDADCRRSAIMGHF